VIRLITIGELVALLDSLTFAELLDLRTVTDDTRGDEQYLVAASEWDHRRRKAMRAGRRPAGRARHVQ
jgi:hypothetical protein